MSERIDELYEEAGRRIYEAQRARLKDQSSITAVREWRSRDVPSTFWDGYCADARAALSALSMRRRLRACTPQQMDGSDIRLRNGSPSAGKLLGRGAAAINRG